ncbi:hypothetical protein N7539_006095 [Penicillium diatomitis]|uniref:RWD domain-containing protein n=1 Tax=Penicillium diatomitis TaxID=2819901 RepID=A0A9X0BT06_9EURO|nr:uncharacterized protein N7539_006095 [Penicillium diatomitis]KAJ5482649.1 hypothetical protein N7539_006095 [Penicillium diatomitis]
MGREDQTEEREVLDSIFPDEITDISETSYRISITLDPPENGPGAEDQPVIFLEVSYPEDYPDVAPDLKITPVPNAPKHPLLELPEDEDVLTTALNNAVEENMGMAMVFALVSALKEAAEQLMIERVQAVEDEKAVAAQKVEEEENKKFRGTPKVAKEEKKLTGRQLWERGLAGKADFDDEDEDYMPPIEKLKVAA